MTRDGNNLGLERTRHLLAANFLNGFNSMQTY